MSSVLAKMSHTRGTTKPRPQMSREIFKDVSKTRSLNKVETKMSRAGKNQAHNLSISQRNNRVDKKFRMAWQKSSMSCEGPTKSRPQMACVEGQVLQQHI